MSLGFPFLNIGVTLAFFQSVGTTPSAMDAFMILISGLAIISAESLNRRGDILSKPADLLVFNFLSSVRVNCSVISFSSLFYWWPGYWHSDNFPSLPHGLLFLLISGSVPVDECLFSFHRSSMDSYLCLVRIFEWVVRDGQHTMGVIMRVPTVIYRSVPVDTSQFLTEFHWIIICIVSKDFSLCWCCHPVQLSNAEHHLVVAQIWTYYTRSTNILGAGHGN